MNVYRTMLWNDLRPRRIPVVDKIIYAVPHYVNLFKTINEELVLRNGLAQTNLGKLTMARDFGTYLLTEFGEDVFDEMEGDDWR